MLRFGKTVNLQLYLLQAVLVPVLQDGCQVWGMHNPLVAAARLAHIDLQYLYDSYLRTICDLLPSTPGRMPLAELAFAGVVVAADLAVLEQLGCAACRLLLPDGWTILQMPFKGLLAIWPALWQVACIQWVMTGCACVM